MGFESYLPENDRGSVLIWENTVDKPYTCATLGQSKKEQIKKCFLLCVDACCKTYVSRAVWEATSHLKMQKHHDFVFHWEVGNLRIKQSLNFLVKTRKTKLFSIRKLQ